MAIKEPEQKPGPIPYFSTTKRDGFTVPALQALFTAGLSGASAGAAVLLAAWVDAPIDEPFKWAVIAFTAVFFPVALITWQRAKEHFMYIIENAMLVDLNKNGIPDILEAQQSPTLKITAHNGKGMADRDEVEYDELPYADRLPEMARRVAAGINFTFQNFGSPGQLFTQPEWTALTDQLRREGYITYKNPNVKNLGYAFTEKGKQLLAELLEQGSRIEREMRPRTNLSQFAVELPPLPQLRAHR